MGTSILQPFFSSAPVRLEPTAHTFTLTVHDINGLLNNSPQAINDIKQQVRSMSFLQGRSVGQAIVYGGAPNDASTLEA